MTLNLAIPAPFHSFLSYASVQCMAWGKYQENYHWMNSMPLHEQDE